MTIGRMKGKPRGYRRRGNDEMTHGPGAFQYA